MLPRRGSVHTQCRTNATFSFQNFCFLSQATKPTLAGLTDQAATIADFETQIKELYEETCAAHKVGVKLARCVPVVDDQGEEKDHYILTPTLVTFWAGALVRASPHTTWTIERPGSTPLPTH